MKTGQMGNKLLIYSKSSNLNGNIIMVDTVKLPSQLNMGLNVPFMQENNQYVFVCILYCMKSLTEVSEIWKNFSRCSKEGV